MSTIAALYGAGRNSLLAERLIHRYASHIEVKYLVENKNFHKLDTKISRLDSDAPPLSVISLAQLNKLYKMGKCHKVIVPAVYHLFDLREIRNFLSGIGIAPSDILAISCSRLRAPLDIPVHNLELWTTFDSLLQIHHLDIHVLDHCNIKCKSCAHFCSLVPTEKFYDSTLLARSLRQLHMLIPHIESISLLGGEPLLHPDLNTIVSTTREIYPYARINVVTNALLLKKMPIKLIEALQKNDVMISISLYPPLQHHVDNLISWLRGHNLKWNILRIERFERRLVPKPIFNGEQMFAKCGHDMCLRGTRIGYCVMALFTDYFNQYFKQNLLPEDPGLDIFTCSDGESLLSALHQPLALCNHCISCDAGEHYSEAWSLADSLIQPDDWFLVSPNCHQY